MRATHTSRVVVVTDAEQRAALAIVRSLGAAGYHVYACSHTERPLAGASRWARETVRVPDPLAEPADYAEAIADLCIKSGAGALIPVGEPSMLAILERRDLIPPHTAIPFPDLASFRDISDKEALLGAAERLGIRVPGQTVLVEPGYIPPDLEYPVVIKPARSVSEAAGTRWKLGVEYASNEGDLRVRLSRLPAAAYPILLQQRIVGPGVGIFLLVWDGEVRAVFAHKRLREKPPSGGVSVYRESAPADAELVDFSRRLLESFKWRGVAMIEYKVDSKSGTPYLMEVNGRFWGSLQLAIDAGVNFPVLLLKAATGETTQHAPGNYRLGVRSRWWWGDVDQLLLRLRNSLPTGALPPDSPGRLRSLIDFMKLWAPGDRNEVLRLNDPRPFFRETRSWFADLRSN